MAYARTLLSEIKKEGGDDFLASLRNANITDEKTLFDPLDDAVFDIKNRGLQIGEFTEFMGPAGSGKTTLLYYLAIRAVLPQTWNFGVLNSQSAVPIGGAMSSVIVFDNDGKWNISRLRALLRTYIEEKIKDASLKGLEREEVWEPPAETHIVNLVNEGLSRLYIYKPQSSLSLLASVQGLSEMLCSSLTPIPRVKYVYIDSITAFMWQDRLTSLDTGEDIQLQIYKKVVNELRQFARKWNSIVMATNWALPSPGKKPKESKYIGKTSLHTPTDTQFKDHAPSSWSQAVSLRFFLNRKPIVQFSPGVEITEAENQNQSRLEVIQRGIFMAVADMETITSGGNKHNASRKEFEFMITE